MAAEGDEFYANSFAEFRDMGCDGAAFEVLREGLAAFPTSATLLSLATREGVEAAPKQEANSIFTRESSEAAAWILQEQPSGEFRVEEPGFDQSTVTGVSGSDGCLPAWRVQLLAKASTALAYCLGERDCLRLAEAGLQAVGGNYSQDFFRDDDDDSDDDSDVACSHDLATALCDLARSLPGVNEPPAGFSVASSCKAWDGYTAGVDGRMLIGAGGRTLSPTAPVF
eukprot:CAMPEP_0172678352 /NCGR_PEP_ID=MMETSP1074-20121228/15339_1 /TAXON_ID=2916 /ORGANISM="Ceratium fusus, Strain PA161109" /LENGTH=225 /DNA_ID=CAMNT_0013496371 /DNA_START=71 /DNA_END=748 /DNA_ORIENTATION=-